MRPQESPKVSARSVLKRSRRSKVDFGQRVDEPPARCSRKNINPILASSVCFKEIVCGNIANYVHVQQAVVDEDKFIEKALNVTNLNSDFS